MKGDYIMVDINTINKDIINELSFTDKEIEEIVKASMMPIAFDADCPEVTPEKAVKFRRVNPPR